MHKRIRLVSLVLAIAIAVALWPVERLERGAVAHAASSVAMLYGSAPDAPDSELQALVEDTVGELGGDWGVAVKKLDTGQYAVYNGDMQHVSASLYKLWVL